MNGRTSLRNLNAAVAFALIALPALLTSCSGGTSSTPAAAVDAPLRPVPTPVPGPSSSGAPQSIAQIRIAIPAATALEAKRRAYVSPATGSLSLAVDGGPPSVFAVGPHAAACVDEAGGGRTCTFSIGVTAGSNRTIVATTYASGDGSGTPLSLATLVVDIVAGKTNPIALTLNGVVAGFSVRFASATLPYGVAGSTTVVVDALDSAGETIVGPGRYVDRTGKPIAVRLTDSDTTGATKLGADLVGAPGAGTPFTYSGIASAGATVTAVLGGFANASAAITFTCAQPASKEALYVDGASATNGAYFELPLALSGAPQDVVASPNFLAFGLAVDRAGRVYQPVYDVAGQDVFSSGIDEFCPQASGTQAVPYRSVVTSSGTYAVDASRNLYVLTISVNDVASISQYAPDSGNVGDAPSAAPTTAPSRVIAVDSTANIYQNGVFPILGAAGNDVFLPDGEAVIGYTPSQRGLVAPAITIANNAAGLILPASVAVNADGDAFVSYTGDWRANTPVLPKGAIAVYGSASHRTPLRVISGNATGIEGKGTLAFDAAGNIGLLQGTSISVFGANASGNVAPLRVISLHGNVELNYLGDWAIDPGTGDIYVCSIFSGVYVFDASGAYIGTIAPTATGIGYANGLVFDDADDLVIQSTTNPFPKNVGIDALLFYPPGTTSTVSPKRTVSLGAFNAASSLARDTAGNFYEISIDPAFSYSVAEFAPNVKSGDAPISSFFDPRIPDLAAGGIFGGGGTVDRAGNAYVFVSGSNNVYVYPHATSGTSVVPEFAIGDYAASTDGVQALATDASGNLYVGSLFSAAISVYKPGATSPFRTIVGPHTRLSHVESVAADDGGDVFVTNQGGSSLVMFDASANGDAAPSRVYDSAKTAFGQFGDLAVGPASLGETPSSTAFAIRDASRMLRRSDRTSCVVHAPSIASLAACPKHMPL